MPYIKQERRAEIATKCNPLAENAGELNFAITMLLIGYCVRNGLNYQRINDCVGALEGAKMEFYCRVAAPYEDTKIVENGDLPYYEKPCQGVKA